MTVASCGAFRFFAISTFDCFCLLCACVGVRMHICVCVCVFSFYYLYIIYNPFYASIFLNCHGMFLFYVLTSVALLNIVIDTSAL